MNALDKFIYFYQLLVFLKLILMLSGSVALLAIFAYNLSIDSRETTTQFIFVVGGIVVSILSLVYVLKRWISSYETWATDWPRIVPLLWTVYGTILFAIDVLPHSTIWKATVGLLWVVASGLLFKMRFPMDSGKEIRA